MTRVIWKDGRFSWGFMAAVVFVTVSLLVFDLAWRAIKLPFDTFLIYCVVIDLAAAAVLFLAFRLSARMLRRSR